MSSTRIDPTWLADHPDSVKRIVSARRSVSDAGLLILTDDRGGELSWRTAPLERHGMLGVRTIGTEPVKFAMPWRLVFDARQGYLVDVRLEPDVPF